MIIHTKSTSETIQLGKLIGSLLQPGDVVALFGELGTGKTHFIKGLAAGLGVGKSDPVSSPSFTLIHEHTGRMRFYHVDLFRLRGEEEAEDLGLDEYLHPGGVTAIEWADKIPSLLPKEALRIYLHYVGKQERSIEIVPQGDKYLSLLKDVESFLAKQRR
jgi:tRNA threonylcarbamoyladenosine biosynthesis protein TsaE